MSQSRQNKRKTTDTPPDIFGTAASRVRSGVNFFEPPPPLPEEAVQPEYDPRIDFSEQFDNVIEYLDRIIAAHEEKLVPKSLSERVLESMKREDQTGEERDKAIQNSLRWYDENGFQRSMHQRAFHNEFRRACMSIVYKDCFDDVQDRLMMENGWPSLPQEVVVVMARRMGKTLGTAMYAVASLLNIPNLRISIYSVSKNSAAEMLRRVKELYEMNPASAQFKIVQKNQTCLEIQSLSNPNDHRTVVSFTSCENMSILFLVRVCVLCV